jgi:hypothetical protein
MMARAGCYLALPVSSIIVMRHQRPVLQYAPPPQKRRRPFLARPFWRDYVVAYLLIGAGIVVGDIGIPDRSPRRWLFLVPGIISLTAGCAVLLCAIAHGIWTRARGADHAA